MRTNEEILNRVNDIKDSDFFGFETNDLLIRLPFEMAKSFLKDDVTESDWTPAPNDKESILKEMEEYMSFAWDKANGCRGISAARSMGHYMAWIWLLGDDLGNLNEYEFYGKDNLRKICNHYGWDANQWDDGIRSNSEY